MEIHKSLQYSTHFNPIGGSSIDDHGKYAYEQYISGLPFVNQPDFVEKIQVVVNEHDIDFIMPAHDNVLLKLAQAKAAGRLSCCLVTSPLATCEIATSKLKTYKALKDVVPTPRIFAGVEEVVPGDFPVFMKPEVGNGSRGIQTARTTEEIVFYSRRDPSLLILEHLPGKEYTVDCFTDKNGELRFCRGRLRARISNGISVNSVATRDERFGLYGARINASLQFRGAWFFQLKERKDGELVLMEIAPRIAGTMGLVRCMGINMPLLSLFDAIGGEVDVIENNCQMVIDRALHNGYSHNISYKHVYLDLDDLVIVDGKVNPKVMAFVFQCINRSIQVHLITKHKNDLHRTLKSCRLSGLFDELIWIRNKEEKHEKIIHKDAIFIDDSYAERKRVHEQLGIPVFDAHMLESLLEKI